MQGYKIALLHIKGKENVGNSVNVFVELSVGVFKNTTYTILKTIKSRLAHRSAMVSHKLRSVSFPTISVILFIPLYITKTFGLSYFYDTPMPFNISQRKDGQLPVTRPPFRGETQPLSFTPPGITQEGHRNNEPTNKGGGRRSNWRLLERMLSWLLPHRLRGAH